MIVKISNSECTPNTLHKNTTTDKPVDYVALLPTVEKNIAHETRFYNLQGKYLFALQQYFAHDCSMYQHYDFFCLFQKTLFTPEEYFFSSDSHLCFLSYTIPPFATYPGLYIKKLSLSTKDKVESEFITALYQLVRMHNNISSQQKHEFDYFNARPLCLELYNFLLTACIQIDENLFIKKDNQLYLLNHEYFSSIKLNTKGILTSTLVDFLKKHLNEKYSSVRPEITYFLYTSFINSSEYSLLYYTPDNSKKPFSVLPLNNQTQSTLFPDTYKEYEFIYPFIKFHNCTMLSPRKPICSNFISDFLYKFTNGNHTTLNNLARLFASMATPEQISNVPFAIFCPQEVRKLLLETLNILFQSANQESFFYNEALPYPSLKDLSSPKCISSLATIQYSHARSIIITDCSFSKGADSHAKTSSTIKALLKGNIITHEDKLLGKMSYRNTLPLICFPSDMKELNHLTDNYKAIGICLNHLSTEYFADDILNNWDANSCDWLNISFTLHGLLLFADSQYSLSKEESFSTQNTVNADTILRAFVKCCCDTTVDKKEFTYADEMHQAYCLFVKKRFSLTPNKRIQMRKKLQAIFGFGYIRPHTSNSKANKYALTGVKLKDNWEKNIESIDQPTDYEKWHQTLSQIDSIVPDALYSD